MTREIENQLEGMLAAAADLPGDDFTARVMSDVLGPRRRERLIRVSGLLAALMFCCLLLWQLEPLLGTVAGSPRLLPRFAAESWRALSGSPLVCVYGTALGAVLLARLLRRLHIHVV